MIARKPLKVDPHSAYVATLLLQFLVLLSVIIPVSDPMVFLLFLFTTVGMALRLKFHIKPAYMLIDVAVTASISFFYPPAYLCLFIYAYYFAYHNKLAYLAPLILMGILINDRTFYLALLQAVLLGAVLYQWLKDSTYYIGLDNSQRRHIYELESVQAQLLADYQDTETISRLTERQRIAEILHDNLGHELTAAHLSLRAYQTLIENNKPDQAQKALQKAEDKVGNALNQLKDSIRYIEPAQDTGFNDLTGLIDNYIYPINFTHSGPVLNLKPYIWQLILKSVKEALTNITKHAHPKTINITFEVTDYIVRLVIENDGLGTGARSGAGAGAGAGAGLVAAGGWGDVEVSGHGLRYMRSRLEAINGSLSVQRRDTFKLIIIIPIESGGDRYRGQV